MVNKLQQTRVMSRVVAGLLGGLLLNAQGEGFVGAQEANFGKLELGSGQTSGVLRGTTGGSTSLPAIVSNTDYHNEKCLGFADPKPDHILILQKDFSSLSLRVNSGRSDTTLVIQGPEGIVRCGNASSVSRDAAIADANWKAGIYKVWVGTGTAGVQRDYVVTVQP